MYRALILVLALSLSGETISQNITDIVYQNTPIQLGTPRFTATAGAFTALGNDLSGVHVNPAGLAVFRHDEFGITLGWGNNTVSSTYYGQNQSQDYNSFLFTNIGYTKKFLTDDPDFSWNIGITYNRNSSFNQESEIFGVNPQSSIIQSWIKNADGTAPQNLFDDGLIYEGLAYEAYLMDARADNSYTTEAEFNETQQFWGDRTKGRTDELGFTFAADKENVLYYGASINIPFYRYENTFYMNESGYGGDSIKGMEWYEEFENKGAGINIKIGAIYRPIPNLRVGVSIFSPTWLSISQTYSTTINGVFRNSKDYAVQYKQPEEFNYSTRTAPQANVGLAYIFNKNGFISIDYAFMPTRWAGSSTEELSYLKNDIKSYLLNQHNVRVGAEIRLVKFFLRGGYSWLSNPYNILDQDASKSIYSFGVGYRTNKMTIDLSYSIANQDYTYYPYSPDLVQPARQNISQMPFLASVSFRL